MWQVSVRASAEAEEAVACLLERLFRSPATVYCDEATGARTATVYPKRLPQTASAARSQLLAELARLRECGLEMETGRVSIKLLRERNWAQSWKRHFKPIDIDRELLIKPPWSNRRARRGQAVVILNPGLSFGTGQHPTTLFCLQRLVRCRRPGQAQSLLDIGTGSGILAIAAAKLGYSPVEAFDNDPVAVRISRQNSRRNRVFNKVRPMQKDLTRMLKKRARQFDVICANLVHDLLISEASQICGRLKTGGILIVAGLLRRQFGPLAKVLRRFNLTLRERRADKLWMSGEFVLR